MQKKFGNRLHVYRLDKNCGLGIALNYGIEHCKNNLVARMDSDDISKPERCKIQLEYFDANQECCLLSSSVDEFTEDIEKIVSRRMLPSEHKEIVEFSRMRNPMNHPCVMYKKDKVIAAGGYQDFYLLEDYYLWVRMICSGAVLHNIKESLLWMRTNMNLYARRGGIKYMMSQLKLLKYMLKIQYISFFQFVSGVIFRILLSLMPNWLRAFWYKIVIRRSYNGY